MRALVVLLALLAVACAPDIPPRFVLERDIDGLAYRRYQHVLDVEFLVPDNPAEGHTATYVRRGDSREALVFATAFVTVYERSSALTAAIREQLEELGTYEIDVVKRAGEWMWELRGEAPWLLWVSGRYLVKLGGPPGGEIPEELVDAYADLYPSDLDETGRAREGSASAGNIQSPDEEDEELDVPRSLREGAPR